jgi:hypothetical protein
MGGGRISRGKDESANKILIGNPEGRRLLERVRYTWEDNIKMDLRKIGWIFMDWIHLSQDKDHWCALVSTAMNLWFP